MIPSETLSEPITDFIQFSQSQPTCISQYYAQIICEYPAIDVYNMMKESNKIIMATDGGIV